MNIACWHALFDERLAKGQDQGDGATQVDVLAANGSAGLHNLCDRKAPVLPEVEFFVVEIGLGHTQSQEFFFEGLHHR